MISKLTRNNKNRNLFIVAIAATLLLTGCVEIRQFTYPSSFTWIGKEEIETSMRSMANSMSEINRLVSEEKKHGNNRGDILIELDNIEYVAASLSIRTPVGDSNLPATNHLLIDENMDTFLENVLRARMQAESNPANYYAVGQLTGSCAGCHRLR